MYFFVALIGLFDFLYNSKYLEVSSSVKGSTNSARPLSNNSCVKFFSFTVMEQKFIICSPVGAISFDPLRLDVLSVSPKASFSSSLGYILRSNSSKTVTYLPTVSFLVNSYAS